MIRHLLLLIVLTSFNSFAFAEDLAPVYEAEAYTPSQLENQSDDSSNMVASYAGSPALTVEQRVTKLEQAQDNLQNPNKSSPKVDSLQTQIQELRAQIEDLQHQMAQVKTNTEDLKKIQAVVDQLGEKLAGRSLNPNHKAFPKVDENKDVTKTDSTDTNKENNTDATASDTTTPQPNIAEEQQIYQSAYNSIKDKKYDQAVSDLKKMLQKYPSGQFAGNAHYWLGELYNLMGNNSQSASEFSTVIDKFPDSAKVADAQLKIGMIYATQSKWSDAKSSFKKVVKKYPGTASARLASEQLKQIKSAGH